MRLDNILDLTKKDLASLVEICRRDSRFFDGVWFMNIEDRFGFEQAMDIHCDMWGKFGEYQSKLIKRAFNLGNKPMSALVRAVNIDPAWLFWDYTMDQVSDTQALFRVTGCKAQRARVKMGRGINPDCQKVDGAYFTSFVRVIDPMIKVKCNLGPPDKCSDNLWCEWCFYLEEENNSSIK
jgi:hypothetical protein